MSGEVLKMSGEVLKMSGEVLKMSGEVQSHLPAPPPKIRPCFCLLSFFRRRFSFSDRGIHFTYSPQFGNSMD